MRNSASSRQLVDPELLDLLDVLPTLTLTAGDLADLRARPPVALPVDADPDAEAVKVSMHSIRGPEGAPNIRLHVYQPPQTADGVGCIFHIHGGGHVSGEGANLVP